MEKKQFTFSYRPRGTTKSLLFTAKFNTDLISNESNTGVADLAKLAVTEIDKTSCTDIFTIPYQFDFRDEYFEYLTPISDQGSCGSCWAFASTSVLASRFALATNQKVIPLSAAYSVFCAASDFEQQFVDGCQGGSLIDAFSFFNRNGSVPRTCLPYSLTTWQVGSSVVKRRVYENFTENSDNTAAEFNVTCPLSHCMSTSAKQNPEKLSFYKTVQAYIVAGTTRQHKTSDDNIRLEMTANGPVSTGFEVRQDFMNYWKDLLEGNLHGTDLIYKPKLVSATNASLGGHAVVLVGWYVINKVKCWVVANSWGATVTDFSVKSNLHDYGNNGYFLFLRGENACAIESNVVSGIPKVDPRVVSAMGFNQHDRISRLCGLVTYEINPETRRALKMAAIADLPDTLSLAQWEYPPITPENTALVHASIICPQDSPHRCAVTSLCVPSPINCGEKIPSKGKYTEMSSVSKQLQAAIDAANDLATPDGHLHEHIDALIDSYKTYEQTHDENNNLIGVNAGGTAITTARTNTCNTGCIIGTVVGVAVVVIVIIILVIYKVKPKLLTVIFVNKPGF